MSVPVTLVGYFDIPTGKAEQFRANCEAMLALRDEQPGLLGAAYSFDGDTAATSREDYENADAVVRHMELGEHIYERTRISSKTEMSRSTVQKRSFRSCETCSPSILRGFLRPSSASGASDSTCGGSSDAAMSLRCRFRQSGFAFD